MTSPEPLLAAASAVLEVMAARVADDDDYSYVNDIRRVWDEALLSAGALSTSVGVAPTTARAFDELVEAVVRLPDEMIIDWLDLFPRNVLDLVLRPTTATGRKVLSIHGDVLRDDIIGIEWEARQQGLDAANPAPAGLDVDPIKLVAALSDLVAMMPADRYALLHNGTKAFIAANLATAAEEEGT
jgi:hypothetical protein